MRAFLTDDVRNGQMDFRSGKKADLAVLKEYLLVRVLQLQETERRMYSKN